jgi:protein ImuB
MERHLVVWCPDLLEQHDHGREARAFSRVMAAVGEFSPHVDPVRPGVCSVLTRGPSRYFGGDEALARLVTEGVGSVAGPSETGRDLVLAGVGIADGLFCAVVAATSVLNRSVSLGGSTRSISPPLPPEPVVVAPGSSADFLSPWPVTILERPELADLLCRLGVSTLGAFAQLPHRQVLARFGGDGAVCRAVAAGKEGELPGLRIPHWTGGTHSGSPAAQVRQLGFFGADAGAEARATEALSAVAHLLHPEAVLVGRLRGGRGPSERARLLPWGEKNAGTLPEGRFRGNVLTTSLGRRAATTDHLPAPWPGQVPSPSPILVLGEPLRAELVDSGGTAVGADATGTATSPPARLSLNGGPWKDISAWAGPWPCDERWWSRNRRRQVRMQVITSDGAAYMLIGRRGWWVEGFYD